MRLADITVPSSPAALAAVEVLTHFSPPALVHHCHRSYLLAAALAMQDRIEVDAELLYVASMLHDLALEPAFDSHTLPFEEAGGHVLWLFTAAAGWPVPRRDRAAGIVVAHMRGADPAIDAEGDLLDVATGLDIGGRHAERWPEPLLAEIVAAYPRLDLTKRFTACFRDQATRKPDSAAAAALRSGLAERLAANPLDQLA